MSAVYCDTSVVVAYYVPETHSAQAEKALIAYGQCMVSSLVLTEASAALRRKVHDRELSKADAQSALDDFRQDMVHLAVAELDGLRVVTADAVMAKAAKELGIKTIWAGA